MSKLDPIRCLSNAVDQARQGQMDAAYGWLSDALLSTPYGRSYARFMQLWLAVREAVDGLVASGALGKAA